MREHWNKKRIIALIHALHKKGERLNSEHIRLHRIVLLRRLHGATWTYFGGWKQAVTASGLDYKKIRLLSPARSFSKKTIIAEIKKRKRSGLSLRGLTVCKEDPSLYRKTRDYFGKRGWKKALNAAGYDPMLAHKPRLWTKRRLKKILRDLHRIHVPLYRTYLKKIGLTKIVSAGVMVFGSWQKAIESIDLRYDKIRGKRYKYWNAKRVVAEIRRLKRNKIPLHYTFIGKYRSDLQAQAKIYYGSWGKAVDAAGIPYYKQCKNWSLHAWLRSIDKKKLQRIQQDMKRLTALRRKKDAK